MIPHRFRFGLWPRVVLALALVGLVPLTVLTIGLRDANRSTLQDQVKKTHAVAVRSVARQVQGYLEQRLALAASLAGNDLVLADPASEAAVETLSAALQANPGVLGLAVLGPSGEEVVRLQWPDRADDVARVVAERPAHPVEQRRSVDPPVYLFTVALADSGASLVLVDSGAGLEGMLEPAELGRDAALRIVNQEGDRVLGEGGDLPLAILEQAVSGRVNGSRVLPGADGEPVVAAVWHVDAAPWAVVSTQPGATAEALARRLDRRTAWAAGIAVFLTLLVAAAAYRGIVRPVRGILEAQRELGGLEVEDGEGSELAQLRASFEHLAERVRDRRELGKVFLGRYQVLELLGEGAMGTVFKGWDPRLRRLVALKTIQISRVAGTEVEEDRGSEAEGAGDLLQEAILAAQFSHPRIVSVYDVEDTPGCAYVAMELVEGSSLEHYLDLHGRLPVERVVPLAAAVSSALAAAHEHGLIHRDIKPANVLLGNDGTIKVGDFGIASFVGALKKDSEFVFGTPGFMAPEVIRGEPASAASDLFALGVVLYRSLSGRLPFRGSTVRKMLMDTILREPETFAEMRVEVPEDVERTIRSLLAKDPSARSSSGHEVARWFGGLAGDRGWRWEYEPEAEIDFLQLDAVRTSPPGASGLWETIRSSKERSPA